jgi:hypothetical protein
MQRDINRLYAKAVYQRNMLIAQASVVVFVGIVAAAFIASDHPADVTRRNVRIVESSVVVHDTSVVQRDSTRTARRIAPSFNPYAQKHEGFLGFITLRPKPSVPVHAEAPIVPAITAPDFTPSDSIVSFSLVEGDDTGVFIPEDVDLWSQRQNSELQVVPCAVVAKVDPEYPPYALSIRKEGEVTVELPVTENGRIGVFPPEMEQEYKDRGYRVTNVKYVVNGTVQSGTVAITEDPPGYWFASSLLKVLGKWEFQPFFENGVAVPSLMVVGYSYCLTDSCRSAGQN